MVQGVQGRAARLAEALSSAIGDPPALAQADTLAFAPQAPTQKPAEEIPREVGRIPAQSEGGGLASARARKLQAALEAELGKAPLGFLDALKEVREHPSRVLPFVGAVAEGALAAELHGAASRAERGEASEDDLRKLAEFVDRGQREKTIGYRVASILSQLPAFGVEFAASSGLFSAGRKVTEKAVGAALKGAVERSVASTAARVATRAAGVLGGLTAAQVGMAPQIVSETWRRTLPALGVQDTPEGDLAVIMQGSTDDFLDALPEGVISTWIEFGSETLGAGFARLPGVQKLGILQGQIARKWLVNHPQEGAEGLARVLAKAGWNGVIPEVLEERAADAGRALFLGDEWAWPEVDQLAAELIAFSVPGAAVALADRKAAAPGETAAAGAPPTGGQGAAGTSQTPSQEQSGMAMPAAQGEPIAVAPETPGTRIPVSSLPTGSPRRQALDRLLEANEADPTTAAIVEPSTPSQTWAREFLAQRGVQLALVDTGATMRAPAAYTEGAVLLDARLSDEARTRAVVFHELAHHLEQASPESWEGLHREIERIDPKGLAAARSRYGAAYEALRGAAPEAARERSEGVSRYVEDVAGYLDALAGDLPRLARTVEQNRGFGARLLDALVRLANRIPGVRIPDTVTRALRRAQAQAIAKGLGGRVGAQQAEELAGAIRTALDATLGAVPSEGPVLGTPVAAKPKETQSKTQSTAPVQGPYEEDVQIVLDLAADFDERQRRDIAVELLMSRNERIKAGWLARSEAERSERERVQGMIQAERERVQERRRERAEAERQAGERQKEAERQVQEQRKEKARKQAEAEKPRRTRLREAVVEAEATAEFVRRELTEPAQRYLRARDREVSPRAKPAAVKAQERLVQGLEKRLTPSDRAQIEKYDRLTAKAAEARTAVPAESKGKIGRRSDAPITDERRAEIKRNAEAAYYAGWASPDPPFTIDTKRSEVSDLEFGIDARMPLFAINGAMHETATERQIRRWQDFLHPLKKLSDEFKPVEANDAYLLAQTWRGEAKEKLTVGTVRYARPLKKALKSSDAGDVSRDEFNEFLIARHAPERNEVIQGRTQGEFGLESNPGSGMRDSEAVAILERVMKDPRRDAFLRAARLHDRMTRETLDILVRTGLETQEYVDGLQSMYKYYTPLRSDLSEDPVEARKGGKGVGRGLDVRGRAFRTAMGRTTMADDPLAFAFTQFEQAIIRGAKNKPANALLRFFEEHPELGTIDVPETKRVVGPDGYVRNAYDPKYKLRDNVISVRRDGIEHHITVEAEHLPIALAWKNLDASVANKFVKTVGIFTRFYAGLNTRNNPFFLPRNFWRDYRGAIFNAAEHGWAMSRALGNPINTFRGIRAVFNAEKARLTGKPLSEKQRAEPWAQMMERYRTAGGPITFLDLGGLEAAQRKLDAMMRDPKAGTAAKVREGWDQFLQVFSLANDAVEMGTRLSAFKNAIEILGMSDTQAASLSKDITTNFERKGEFGNNLNSLYVFANAGIQSVERTGRALKNPRTRKLLAAAVAGSIVLEMVNRAIGGEDDDGELWADKVPGWEKRTSTVFMIPGTEGVRINVPSPFVYSWFSQVGVEIAAVTSSYMGLGTRTPGEAGLSLAIGAMDTFNPLGGASQPLEIISPTFLDPLVQIGTNRDWAGRSIRPEDFPGQHRARSEAYWPDVNPLARSITGWLNRNTGGNEVESGALSISPEYLEFFAAFLTGGLGAELGRIAESGQRALTGEVPELRNVPLARSFVRYPHPAQDEAQFRRDKDKIEEAEALLRAKMEKGDIEAARKVRDEKLPLLRLSERAKAVEKMLRAFPEGDPRRDDLVDEFHRMMLEATSDK